MKPLNRYIIILSSIVCLLAPKKIARACGFYVYPGEYRFWLLQPDLTNTRDLSPFFFATSYLYYGAYEQLKNESVPVNIDEWYEYCNHSVAKKDIDSLLYNTEPDEFLTSFDKLKKNNSFARYIAQPVNKELLQYMQLSKKIETIAAHPDPWEENPQPNQHTLKVINEANVLYQQSKSDWLRLRTAYQLMRLYRYNHQPEEIIKVYDSKFTSAKSNSWVTAAAIYEKASAVKRPESDYLYSKAFDRGYRRSDCLIKFNSDGINKILPFAKNDHERTVLYAMQVLNYPGKSLKRLKDIYTADPGYKDFTFLLLREINKVEDWLMTGKVTDFSAATRQDLWGYDYEKVPQYYQQDVVYAKELYAFITQVIKENKIKEPAILNLYASHLALVQEDYAASRTYLQAIKKYKPVAPNVKTQVRVNELLLNIITQKKFDVVTEKQLMAILKTPAKDLGVHSPDLLKDQLILFVGKKLIAKGERAKGLLLLSQTHRAFGDLPISTYKNIYQQLAETATPADYDTIIAVLDKPQKTAFEKFTTRYIRLPWDYYYSEDDTTDRLKWDRNKVLDCKATWYIRNDNLEAALKTLQQIPRSFWKEEPYSIYIKGNPFYLNIYHSWSAQPGEGKNYNKIEVVETMVRLKKLAVKDKANAAQYYYELANAWYNMSYHGKNWLMMQQWWSTNEMSEYHSLNRSDFNAKYYGCQKAKEYYLAALKATSDKKLASLCCFMADKCQQNYRMYNWLSSGKKGTRKTDNPYLAELKKKGFSDGYYKDLVNECLTYQSFIKAYNRKL